mgnify:CR=1 FL=1
MRAAALLTGALVLAGCALQQNAPLSGEQATRAARANTDIASHHLRNGALEPALDRVERALQQDPGLIDAHLVAAELQSRLDEPAAAVRHFQSALALDAQHGPTLNNYAAFLCTNGERRRALDLWDMAAAQPLYSGRVSALGNAARCLDSAGRVAAAAAYWQRALALQPDHAPALRGMAESRLAQQQPATAWTWFSRYTAEAAETPALLWLGVRIARAAGHAGHRDRLTRRLRAQFPASEQAARLME